MPSRKNNSTRDTTVSNNARATNSETQATLDVPLNPSSSDVHITTSAVETPDQPATMEIDQHSNETTSEGTDINMSAEFPPLPISTRAPGGEAIATPQAVATAGYPDKDGFTTVGKGKNPISRTNPVKTTPSKGMAGPSPIAPFLRQPPPPIQSSSVPPPTAPPSDSATSNCPITGMDIDPDVGISAIHSAETNNDGSRKRQRVNSTNDGNYVESSVSTTATNAPVDKDPPSTAKPSNLPSFTRIPAANLSANIATPTAAPLVTQTVPSPTSANTQNPSQTPATNPSEQLTVIQCTAPYTSSTGNAQQYTFTFTPPAPVPGRAAPGNAGTVLPPPPGGFPRAFQGHNAESLRQNQLREHCRDWDNIFKTNRGILLRPYNGIRNQMQQETAVAAARLAIMESLPSRREAIVAYAERDPNGNAFPEILYATDIPPADVQFLLDRQTLNTTHGTFFAIAFNPPPSSFIMTIEGLTYGVNSQVEVGQLARHVISRDPRVNTFIMGHRDAVPANIPANNVAAAVINTVSVRPLPMTLPGGQTRVVWNLFMEPPTHNITYHSELLMIFRAVVFRTPLYGTGHAIPNQFRCVRCGSLDHPTGLCPFPLIPGWIDTTQTNTQTNTSTETTGVNNYGGPSRGRGKNFGRGLARGRGGSRGRGY